MAIEPAALATALGIPSDAIEARGRGVVKIDPEQVTGAAKGKVVLVTAMTPTPAGEGKTTTTIGLVDGLRKRGTNAVGALREPSFGPLFGMKGGAIGGGNARVEPGAVINMHFTGDLHAVTAAHNLLAAIVENHDTNGDAPQFKKITWGRVLDMNDRGLRTVEVGFANKKPFKSRFDITAASEVMAILCLAKDFDDLRQRLDAIVVGESTEGKPVTAKDVRAAGAMAAVLLDATRPNLVRTLEDSPVFIHGGPFANVAQGTSSLIQTNLARKVADVVVTEAGFAMDLGGFKFLDLKCRNGGFTPAAVVLVATVRAMRFHGGASDYATPNPAAVTAGVNNVVAHVESMQRLGLPTPIISLNRFPDDSPDELAIITTRLAACGVSVVPGTYFADGGQGALALADAVLAQLAKVPSAGAGVTYPYQLADSITTKATRVATVVLGATGVEFTAKAKEDLALVEALVGDAQLPVCLAKTHLSISDDPTRKGHPGEFTLTVTGVRLNRGAGFVVLLCGPIVTMPGLPKQPQAWHIDVVRAPDEQGRSVLTVIGIK